MKITKLEYQKKDPERVNVYLDEEFAFGMNVNDLIEFSIRIGQEIDDQTIDKIIRNDVFSRMYNRALKLVMGALKTEKQVGQYIERIFYSKQKDWLGTFQGEISVDELKVKVIERLKRLDLINDTRFAEAYVDSYYLIKPSSVYELTGKLMTKGISKDVADEVILDKGCDESEMLRHALKKKFRKEQIDRNDSKTISYFSRKGFSWDVISRFFSND